jgi:hypothetical protein
LLACSQHNTSRRTRSASSGDGDGPAAGRLPAIDRYDGPAFRVLRKFLREASPNAPAVLILSAKYGLIDSTTRIADYDCRMSAGLAERLRPTVRQTLGRVLRSGGWRSVALCVGRDYRAALDGLELLLPEDVQVEVIGGGQGRRLTGLRRWLRHEAPGGDGVAAR